MLYTNLPFKIYLKLSPKDAAVPFNIAKIFEKLCVILRTSGNIKKCCTI